MTELTSPYGPQGPPPEKPAVDYRSDPRLQERPHWRRELYRIIFEHDTRAGRAFDVVLILAIIASVVVVMIESVESIGGAYTDALRTVEWVFTAVFTVEYVLRLVSARRAVRYARSFFGVIDLLAILPSFLGLVVTGGQALAVVRILRVLRVFRVLKLAQFIGSERLMLRALRQSAYKIAVFLVAVLTIVVVVGAAMYLVEGPENGFTSIPLGVYWAIVTVTTVGFGDIAPVTTGGQLLAAALMILGYGIIAVPTGIVTAEMISRRDVETARRAPGPDAGIQPGSPRTCSSCGAVGHAPDAGFCRICGAEFPG